jgi:type I restriction enzyme R subunit
MIATRFPASGLLADDAMGFIATLVQLLRRRHYQPLQEG